MYRYIVHDNQHVAAKTPVILMVLWIKLMPLLVTFEQELQSNFELGGGGAQDIFLTLNSLKFLKYWGAPPDQRSL